MSKVVINSCFGGFSLSHEALLKLFELKQAGNDIPGLNVYTPESYFGKHHEHEMALIAEGNSIFPVCIAVSGDSKYVIPDTSEVDRSNPFLVQIVEELGEKANGRYAELRIVNVPSDVDWEVEEYDGKEWVAQKHQTWS